MFIYIASYKAEPVMKHLSILNNLEAQNMKRFLHGLRRIAINMQLEG